MMNKVELKEYERLLKAMRNELEERAERTNSHLYRREEPYDADFAEQAVELENKEVVEQLDDEGKASLKLVNDALARLGSGEYGFCSRCGAQVNAQRLLSLPETPYCIACAVA